VFQISNLKRMRTDPNYQELRELHAENNQIVSMHEIEASNFIKNFQVLDIRGNRLTEVSLRLHYILYCMIKITESTATCLRLLSSVRIMLLPHYHITKLKIRR